MTKPDPSKPAPLPLLLVYGKPTSPDLPQASWFRIEECQAVSAAAHVLKLSVIDISTEEDRALLAGVHEGVLKGNGRIIVGSVAVEVYQRIEERFRARAGGPETPAAASNVGGSEATEGQNKNIEKGPAPSSTGKAVAADDMKPTAASATASASNRPIAAAASDPWDALRIGSHVVAKFWEEDGEAAGWWVGTITGFDKKDYVIVWLDDPNKTPPFKIERKHVAILHPAFDVKTEWDERRR